MIVTVSAPGKIFLMGEHAVVYGKPALLSCINKRVIVILSYSAKTQIISLDNKFISQIINLVKNYFRLPGIPGIKIEVISEIKNGYHLGSSAAVSVAVIASLVYLLKKIWNPEMVNSLSFEAEKLKHGNPSGADNSVISFGGIIWYRKELDFLKNIWAIPLNIPPALNHFYLVDTGLPQQSTRQMVTHVSKNYRQNQKNFDFYFSQNEKAVKNIAASLKIGDSKLLLDSIKIGENTLENIGVVSKEIIPFIRQVEDTGGAAKILGGGGKTGSVGYLLCFHPKKEVLIKISEKFNFPLEATTLAQAGLRLEKKL